MTTAISRRRFLQCTAASTAGASLVILPDSRSARAYVANEKLGVALVGIGGRGSWFVDAIPRIGENVVAVCDVNDRRAAESYAKLHNVPKYRDFRKLLDEKDKQIEAVVVATPDNTHAVITAAAIKHGKHVYCEKPLTHDVAEARVVRELAKKHGVATQMGNQGTATGDFRRGVELVQAGVFGELLEVHVWNAGESGPKARPQGEEPVPEDLDWDLWLGPAAWRPYHPGWMRWHTWRDFATGKLGNWGCHSANLPFMALEIASLWQDSPVARTAPRLRLEAEVSEVLKDTFTRWASIRWEVPRRDNLPPIVVQWHNGAQEGRKRIEQHLGRRLDWGDAGERKWKEHGGCLIVGTEGMLRATEHNSKIFLYPEDKFADFQGPPQTLPRSGSHEREWIAACKGGPRAMSNFNYAGPLVEFLMLGNVATQVPGPLQYDTWAGKIVNNAEADGLLERQYRKGWSL
jgi:predicted dehydrogenase